VIEEIRKRKVDELTPIDLEHLQQRIQSVHYWLDHYATAEERLQLQTSLPESAEKLTATQRVFLHQLAEALPSAEWQGDKLQVKIFDVARLIPIRQPMAFQAIYQILFGRDAGPRAGNLFEFLDKDFIIERFKALPFSKGVFWQETALEPELLEKWLQERQAEVQKIQTYLDFVEDKGIIAFFVTLLDGKTYGQRLLFAEVDYETFQKQSDTYLKKLQEELGLM
jgi:lysyl-tRNA synthetase class 1